MFFGICRTNSFHTLRPFVKHHTIQCSYVRRTFLFSSIDGSLTLEAALVLPIYIFFLTAILYILNILHLQNSLQAALEETARYVNSYAYLYEQLNSPDGEMLSDPANAAPDFAYELIKNRMSDAFIKNIFLSDLVKSVTDNSYIKNGHNGLYFRILNDSNGATDINVTYKITIPFLPDKLFSITVNQQCYFKPFIGEDITDKSGDYIQYVYITTSGSAYHTSPYCTYLSRYYYIYPKSELEKAWNDGEIYTPCTQCSENREVGPTSFICPGSNVYHSRLDCIYLEAAIYKIPLDSVGPRHLCTRCENGAN